MTFNPMTLTVPQFIENLEHDHTLAKLYLKYNTNFKMCGEQIFKFNESDNLWIDTATESDFYLSMAEWLEKTQNNFLLEGINKTIELPQDLKKELVNKTTKKMKLNSIKSAYKMATPLLRDDNFIKSVLDKAEPRLVPFGSSVFNLETQEITARTKEHNFSYKFKGEYIKNIKYSSTFTNFINQICCNNMDLVKHLQKIMGYCISGETSSQVFFLFTGAGSNGKSLIMSLLEKIMTDAYQPVKREVMIEKAGYDTGNALYGISTARCAGFQETKTGDKLNEGTIKSITGEDTISCKKLFANLGKATNMKLITKLILCTNKKPEWDSTQHSMVRRFQPFYFNATFLDTQEQINKKIQEDPENKNKYFLKNPNLLRELTSNLNEFFTWCCDGFLLWMKDQNFVDIPKELKEDKQKDIDEQNSVLVWFNERIEKNETQTIRGDPVFKIKESEIYPDYKKFCIARDYKIILTMKEVKTFFIDKIGKSYKTGGIMQFKNVRFLNEKEDTEEKKEFIKPIETGKITKIEPTKNIVMQITSESEDESDDEDEEGKAFRKKLLEERNRKIEEAQKNGIKYNSLDL
jgi:P4 family phage/plasmid primase-like protien